MPEASRAAPSVSLRHPEPELLRPVDGMLQPPSERLVVTDQLLIDGPCHEPAVEPPIDVATPARWREGISEATMPPIVSLDGSLHPAAELDAQPIEVIGPVAGVVVQLREMERTVRG